VNAAQAKADSAFLDFSQEKEGYVINLLGDMHMQVV
jgi:hypothetical protein